ncbi:hypothetical protein GY45DRAFT_1327417 [Cubamyces sp. BRFM 1775]|nr:hypothetical protein GY45DRAFT_1327417 [Cubamyces sp. BRFM 1775]
MAHMHFSWSDSLQAALSSCLPCLKSSDAPSDAEDESPSHQRSSRHQGLNGALAHVVIPPPRARPDELEGLLADASDDAETLSLHSNIGSDRRRGGKHKKKRPQRSAPKHIRVFGYDLFGRPPAIQLPESDDERGDGREGGGGTRPRPRTISTDTLDSDAAPLDPSAIEQLSAARHAEALAREEEERKAKEERRRKRREKRELKRAAMARALELQTNGNEEFEGFQGSGPVYGGPLQPFSPSLGSGSGSQSVSDSQDFGPFAQGQLSQPFDADAALAAEAEADDGADFGGESYTRRPRKSTSGSGSRGMSGTQTTSDTRSSSTGTSHSHSYSYSFAQGGVAPYNHQFLAQQPQHTAPMPRSPLSPLSPGSDGVPASPGASLNGAKKHRRKSTRSKAHSVSVTGSNSSHTPSATASLVSPPGSDAPASRNRPEDGFEGFPGELGHTHTHDQELQASVPGYPIETAPEELETDVDTTPQRKSEPLSVASFPSVGLRGVQRTKSDMGVFLARRGDE